MASAFCSSLQGVTSLVKAAGSSSSPASPTSFSPAIAQFGNLRPLSLTSRRLVAQAQLLTNVSAAHGMSAGLSSPRRIRTHTAHVPQAAAPGAPSTSDEGVATIDIVREVIAKQLDVEIDDLKPNTKFNDLGADSLDTVEIMMVLEERCGVAFEEDGAENMATVQDAANVIDAKKK